MTTSRTQRSQYTALNARGDFGPGYQAGPADGPKPIPGYSPRHPLWRGPRVGPVPTGWVKYRGAYWPPGLPAEKIATIIKSWGSGTPKPKPKTPKPKTPKPKTPKQLRVNTSSKRNTRHNQQKRDQRAIDTNQHRRSKR